MKSFQLSFSNVPIALMLTVVLLTISCTPTPKLQTLDFGKFTINVPAAWTRVKEKGFDSFVGRIALSDGDTISFDLGWYSNPLEEEVPYDVDDDNVYLLKAAKSTSNSREYEFYGKLDTVDLQRFHKNKIQWMIIDNRKAKIVEPKKPGDGMTGIYIDSVWVNGSGIDRFQMNGKDLTKNNQLALLSAFQTLKFINTK